MADVYVRSADGDNLDDGSTWALANATIGGGFTDAGAGGRVYVADGHAQVETGGATFTAPGAAATPNYVLCVDDTGNPEPPTALATTATVTQTGNAIISFAGFAYYQGISFIQSGAGGTQYISWVSTAPWANTFENCNFTLGSGNARIAIGAANANCDDQLLIWKNCTVTLGAHSGQTIEIRGPRFEWCGGSVGGSTTPPTLFTTLQAMATQVRVRGVDLSHFGAGKSLVEFSGAAPHDIQFENCKLSASVSFTAGSPNGPGGARVRMINCDSGDTQVRYQLSCYEGNIFNESTVLLTGGPTEWSVAQTRRMVSSANVNLYYPLYSDWIAIPNTDVGSAKTLTVEVVTDNITLTDAQMWVEVEYLGTSGFPLLNAVSDRVANVLATPVNQTSSSVTWADGSLTTPVKQKLVSPSFTPQEQGVIRARVGLARASTTVYFSFDPATMVA